MALKYRRHQCKRGVTTVITVTGCWPTWIGKTHNFPFLLSRPVRAVDSMQHKAAEMWSWAFNLIKRVQNSTSTATKNLRDFLRHRDNFSAIFINVIWHVLSRTSCRHWIFKSYHLIGGYKQRKNDDYKHSDILRWFILVVLSVKNNNNNNPSTQTYCKEFFKICVVLTDYFLALTKNR